MRNKVEDFDPAKMEAFLKTISSQDFLSFGMDYVAYVRPVTVQGAKIYAVHAADGTPLSISDTLDAAVTTVKDHDMEPATLH